MQEEITGITHKLMGGYCYKIESAITLTTKLFKARRYNILFYNTKDELVYVKKNVRVNNIEKIATYYVNYILPGLPMVANTSNIDKE